MKKLAIFGQDLKFITYIASYLERNYGYQIRIDLWHSQKRHDETKSLEILEWADILFCEWGLGNVTWCQKHKKSNQKLFIRLHRYEMNTKYPRLFDYDKIDQIIVISPYIFEEFHRVAKVPREKMKMIFNAVDTDRFKQKKLDDYQFNIGVIGYTPMLKRLDRALDIFEKLYAINPKYKLYLKGKHPKEIERIWDNMEQRKYFEAQFERIKKSSYQSNVIIEGWGDVSDFLRNIGYVLSVSDYESFHLAPIEGMASGALPVVLEREGAKHIFPDKYILKNTEQAANFISSTSNNRNITELTSFVEERYSLHKIGFEIDKMIQSD